jgi:hypothetical protein
MGEEISMTYVVSVTVQSTIALWNDAVLTQGEEVVDTASVVVLVDPVHVYLPLVLR